MSMILHMFNESSSKGAAAAAKFQLPRGAVWTAFSGEVAEIAFQSKGYRCETWPADVRKYCDGAGFQGPCHLRPYGDETSPNCHSVTAVIRKKKSRGDI